MTESDLNTDCRKVSAAIYRKPVDSKIFGSVEVDVTELESCPLITGWWMLSMAFRYIKKSV